LAGSLDVLSEVVDFALDELADLTLEKLEVGLLGVGKD